MAKRDTGGRERKKKDKKEKKRKRGSEGSRPLRRGRERVIGQFKI